MDRTDMDHRTTSTLLVLDDEQAICEMLGQILEEEGYSVLTAGNATQALDLLDRKPVDLLLLDLHMPGPLDGEELLFLLRDRGEDLPIIIVSGWVDDEMTVHHPECVYGVLKKPIRKTALLEMVRRALS